MQPLVCRRFIDEYLLASRGSKKGAPISENLFLEIKRLINTNANVPEWAIELLAKFGIDSRSDGLLKDFILFKEPTSYSFGRASYEITEVCNYNCEHCYLGKKRKSNLSLDEKMTIIELIDKAGCLWLQLTGGEPLIDRDFIPIYKYAHTLGLLVVLSSNGSLLTKPQIAETLVDCPPYRLALSFYGFSRGTYEALTNTPGSFKQFMAGLDWASETGTRTRLNIIANKHNRLEVADMVSFCQERGFEYHVFTTIAPTLSGDKSPIDLMVKDCALLNNLNEPDKKQNGYIPCNAGQTSFHVNLEGKMSICKTAREPYVNLVSNGENSFSELPKIVDKLMNQAFLCDDCKKRDSCSTCPQILNLYQQSGEVPSYVCSKYIS